MNSGFIIVLLLAGVVSLRGLQNDGLRGEGAKRGNQIFFSSRPSQHGKRTKLRRRQSEEGKIAVFVDEWDRIPNNTIDPWVGEAQGMLMGSHLVITGGFRASVYQGTNRTTALDLSDPNGQWREMAEHPIDFLTHAAHATKGDDLLYMCGGYFAAHPGLHLDDCHCFDKSVGDEGEWTAIPSLPEGRAGGAMLYIESMDSLVFTLGATREPSVDHNTTWMLDLKNMSAGWSYKGRSPYLGNHVSAITARDCQGRVRYFVLGGQRLEMEWWGNIDLVYEYLPNSNTFERRAEMPEPKGHFTTAITPYGCGFIIVGGAINTHGGGSTNDIFYYSIDGDEWTFIGEYPETRKTQVCATYNSELTCSTGYINRGYKRKLKFDVASATDSSPVVAEVSSSPSASFFSDVPSDLPSDGPSVMFEAPSSTIPSSMFSDTPSSSDFPSSTPTDVYEPADDKEVTLFEATFDVSDNEFKYQDGTFRGVPDTNSRYASGMYGLDFGRVGGGLRLVLGGVDDLEALDISGGFTRTYKLTHDVVHVSVTFDYRVGFFSLQGEGEDTEVLCSVDDILYGNTTSTDLDYVDKYYGREGTDEDNYAWIWKTAVVDVGPQVTGIHTIAVGGYRTKKILPHFAWSVILIDNVKITAQL